MGAVSHLPILLSTATVAVTTGHPDWHTMAKLASSGYRDITRLASGNPQINSDILATNREVLIYWVDEFIKGLDRLRRQIATENTDLELVLSQINKARLRWLDGGQKETNSPADHPSDVSQT